MRIVKSLFFLLLIFFLLSLQKGFSQNLALNPSFENTSGSTLGCPGYGNLSNWSNPDTSSTPDLFSTGCSGFLNITGAPVNGLGHQQPRTGTNYAGFIPYDPAGSNYREYIQGQISSPLVAGQIYCVKFYVSLADTVPKATNRVGMYLSNSSTFFPGSTPSTVLPYTPQLQAPSLAITDKVNWVKLEWQYTATGGEQYFTIGNFFNDANTTTVSVSGGGGFMQFVYYYVEDISITPGACCDASITQVPSMCTSDSPITLVPETAGGTWSGPGITSPSAGTFDPSAAGVGTHTIVYTLNCGADSTTIVVNNCISLTACQETNGNITATSGSAPITWYNQTTTQNCSACFSGCVFPPGCAVNVTSWTSFSTGTTVTPTTYPIKMQDSNGDSLLITSLSALPNCPSSSCPAIVIDTTNIEAVSCPGLSDGSFDASSSGGVSPWDYTLKDNGGTTVSTLINVTGTQHFTGLAAGTYTLVTYDANNCADSIAIVINSLSVGSVTANAGPDQTVCSNSALLAATVPGSGTGLWTLVSGTCMISTPSSATSAITGLGVGTVILQWTVNSGCASASDTVSITNTGGGPSVSISSHADITCNGNSDGSATATATGGTGSLTYSWSPNGANQPTANNLSAGTYTISVTDGGGCTAIETITIAEPMAIVANVNATSQGCGNALGSATVSASGGTGVLGYLWNTGETTITITNLSAGTYSVTVTDAVGCTASANGNISTSGGITATAYPDNDTIGLGDTVHLFASGGTSYLWNPSAGLDCSSCRNPVASPEQTTIYCVIASDNGCSDTACVTVIVDESDCSTNFLTAGSVYVPNSFTPGNHDYLNDVFKPIVNCVHNYSFMIFDRWGEKLFETTDMDLGWNGYFKGKMCQPDVYVYKVTFVDDPRNNFHQYIGRVTLLQ